MDIEELHKVVVQGFASLNDKIDSRFAAVDARFETIDARFATIDAQFATIDARFDRVDQELGRVKDALMEHGRQLKDIRAALDRKVDRDELEAPP